MISREKGTLIMFICNHCPYVKAVIEDIVEDTNKLTFWDKISSNLLNDVKNYPEDLENMIEFSKDNKFKFPYIIDETQKLQKIMMLYVLLIFLVITKI